MTPVYADHHATTTLAPEAFEAMRPWLVGLAANPSSVHAFGRAARRAVEEAREAVAAALGAGPSEIVLTSGGTEADNLAIWGAARAAVATRRTVVTTAVEHPAVRKAAEALVTEGFVHHEAPVDADGLPSPSLALSDATAVVSAILANNETGAVNPSMAALAAEAHAHGALCHTDAVQAVGKIPVDVRALGVDLLSLTAHKFGGPKGAGALYVRKGTRLQPQSAGGGQEKGRRVGTENVPAIVGLGAAIALAVSRLEEEARRLGALRDRFEARALASCPGVRRNAAPVRLPTASSLTFPGADGEALILALDLEGIAVSSGSACAAGTTTPSPVLLAMGLSTADARATIRFSFGRTTTEGEVDRILEVLPRLVARATPGRPSVPAA